jgi:hypothetical protein
VTPPLGTRGPALAASTIPPLSVRPCGTRFSNTHEGPNRCRSAPITDPLFRGFGIPNRSTSSLVQRAGRDIPFRHSPDLLGGKETSHVGTGDLPSRGKNTGIEPHPAHAFPTEERFVVVVACTKLPQPRIHLCQPQCSCRSQSQGQPPGE